MWAYETSIIPTYSYIFFFIHISIIVVAHWMVLCCYQNAGKNFLNNFSQSFLCVCKYFRAIIFKYSKILKYLHHNYKICDNFVSLLQINNLRRYNKDIETNNYLNCNYAKFLKYFMEELNQWQCQLNLTIVPN